MTSLLIFDECIKLNNLTFSFIKDKKLLLFPLTSNKGIINDILQKCTYSDLEVEVLETSRIINQTAHTIREKYLEFIANIANDIRIGNENLKEFFVHPDGGISMWWMSLVAEKNTFKSDSFTRLVQFYSIADSVHAHEINKVIVSSKSKNLNNSIIEFCEKNKIEFIMAPQLRVKRSYKEFFSGNISFLLFFFIKWIYIKIILGKRRNILPSKNSKNVLCITYYPNIDTALAEKGIFKNKFYSSLQEEFEKNGKNKIIWVAIYVQRNDLSFHKGLKYAKLLIKNNYFFSYIDEFLTFFSFLKVFFNSIRFCRRFKKIERQLPAGHLFNKDLQVYSIFSEDWNNSFCGRICIENLLYLEAFKNMYKRLNNVDIGIYFYENHAWEKAMISAKNHTGSGIKMLAYQHSTFPRFLLNYFNHPSEIKDKKNYSIPKPDMILCNGNIPYCYFKESGWEDENLSIVEAIRFDYLTKILNRKWDGKKNILLVAFSISIEESSALLTIVHDALKNEKNLTVWLKPHPFLSFKSVLDKTGTLINDHFIIKNDPLEDLLPNVKGVIINESSAAIEALAYGCRIYSINMPEMVNMSQLRNIRSNLVKIVNSPDELRTSIRELVETIEKVDYEESNNLVHRFFYFNTESKPEKFLKIVMEGEKLNDS